MSVRVNLLPRANRAAENASRIRLAGLVVAVLVLAGLGVASLLQNMTLREAQEDLEAAQTDRALAESEVADLAVFAELELQVEEAEAVVRSALGEQATLAGVLQDVAISTPEDVALTSLSIDIGDDEAGGVGVLRASAETVNGIAPGVERYLRILEQVGSFRGVYLASASTDDQDVTTFDVDLVLGPELLTRRFDEVLEPEVSP